MQEIIVTTNESGQRFDKLLSKFLNEAPKSFIYKMLRKKNIVLNGKKATGNEKLETGDVIQLYLSDDTIEKFSSVNIKRTNQKIDIIYEDEHVMLINKPVGMLSQKADASDESLVEHVISYMLQSNQLSENDLRKFKPSVCNRLDRNTSGLVVAGKSLLGLQTMGELFKNRTMKKFYRCLVIGEVTEKQHICGYLKKDTNSNFVTVMDDEISGSIPIETEYEPIWTNGRCTLLEVHLITGRTHQIRVHMKYIGHPLPGDFLYNPDYSVIQRQALHSHRLVFVHPITNQKMEFTSPLPEDMNSILK